MLTFEQLSSIFQLLLMTFAAIGVVIYQRKSPQNVTNAVATAMHTPTKAIVDSTDGLNTAVVQLTGTLQYMTEANSRLANQNADLQKRVSDSEIKAQAQEGRINTYAKSIDELLNEQNQRAKASAERDRLIAELTQKVNVMQDSQAETKKNLEKTQAELDQTRIELGKAKEDLADAQKRLATLETQHTADLAEKERLTLELQQKDLRIKELEARVKELETDLATLCTKLNSDGKEGEVKA